MPHKWTAKEVLEDNDVGYEWGFFDGDDYVGGEAVKAELDRLADENEKLRQVINDAAQPWLALNPGIAWEGGIDAAMRAAVAEIERLRARKDAAFRERNEVVSLLARLFPAGVAKTDIPDWDAEWHGCVYIDAPCGQLSWHFHDSHAPMFAGLPLYSRVYDGHTTEKKYARVAELRETLSAADNPRALTAWPTNSGTARPGPEELPEAPKVKP